MASALHRGVVLLLAAGLGCGGTLHPDAGDAAVDADGGSDSDQRVDGDGVDADGVDARVDSGPDGDAEPDVPRAGPVCLLLDAEDASGARSAGLDFFAHYLTEVLAHAGIPYEVLARSDLIDAAPRCPVLILPYDADLGEEAANAVEAGVRAGGTVMALGGTSGLDALLGVAAPELLEEGYLRVDGGGFLPPSPMPLHAFSIAAADVTTAEPMAELLDGHGDATGRVALSRHTVGEGEAWLVGPDLATTIVRIQQGRPIHGDGEPAPDGTAQVDDGILKTDDGIVLDYVMDRAEINGAPLFLEPVVDLWIDLLLRIVLRGCSRAGARLPMLWYWPGPLNAVGVLSHDSDGNDPAAARALLVEVEAIGVETTWCFMRYPETYPASLFADVAAQGGEVSLHYDARTPSNPETTWSEANFLTQLAWLESVSGREVTTNKNHYLRWEGWVDFYRWCEAAGIEADQSKGPSKTGNVGFLYGTSHPHFPVDDWAHDNRVIDVLAVGLLTQDLVHTCPYEFGPALVDRAVRHHGVAHFLFHPAHVGRAGVSEAMADVVEHGRGLGMEWWTVRQLNEWERARRGVTLEVVDDARFRVHAPSFLPDVTLLVLLHAGEGDVEVQMNGSAVAWTPFVLRGVSTARFTVDLEPGQTEVSVVQP